MFGKLSNRHIPLNGILVSFCFLFIGVVLNYLVPAQVFIYVTSIATTGAIWTWGVIVLAQMKFRSSLTADEVAQLKYPAPFYPVSNWATLIFLVIVLIIMAFDADTRVALYVSPVWFGFLLVCYYAFGLHKSSVSSVSKDVS